MALVDVFNTFAHHVLVVDSKSHADQLLLDNPGATASQTEKGYWEVLIPRTPPTPDYI